VTPPELTGFFTACAAVAGSLVGLLFVAISLRYDAILGPRAEGRSRSVAGAAFTALTNALMLSLLALVPHLDIGYPVAALALGSLWSTFQTHLTRSGRRDTSMRLFLGSLAIYLFQLVDSCVLIARPDSAGLVYNLAYVLFGAFAAALARSWQLLQPSPAPSAEAAAGAAEPGGDGLAGPITLGLGLVRLIGPRVGSWRRRRMRPLAGGGSASPVEPEGVDTGVATPE
jgi:hypothetical protein